MNLPWETRWTDHGESMGYDSRSAIYDATGKHIATLGHGDSAGRAQAELLASFIVERANSAVVVPNAAMTPTKRSYPIAKTYPTPEAISLNGHLYCLEIDALPAVVRVPQVLELVIAAREAHDEFCMSDSSGIIDALDKALEPFSPLVPFENEPDVDPPETDEKSEPINLNRS